jgi:basic amino acid/polyamine antiporter, APA family
MSIPSAAPKNELQRKLGVWSATAVVIGSTIGSGIFRSPAGIADRLPGPLPMMAVWIAGGIFAMCGALTMAEVASAMPRTGGLYVFCRDAWGDLTGFLFGWGQISMIRAASLGGIAITFAEYFFRVLGVNPVAPENARLVHWTAAAAIGLTGAFNYFGVRLASNVINFTVLAKYGGLLFIIVAAFAFGLPHNGFAHYTPAVPPGSFTLPAFGLALVSTLWAFDGWADLAYNAGEVKDPGRNLPRALIGGTFAVLGIYLAANLAYMAVLPIDQIRTSKLVAADVAQQVIGAGGVAFVAVTVMISTFGTLNTVLFTSPRVFFAMADDGLFFKPVAKVHPKFGTPYVAITLVAALGMIFVLLLPFEKLADTFVTAFLPFYMLAVASVFKLRRTPGYNPTFRVPLYPMVPLLFIVSVLYLLGNAIVQESSRMSTLAVLGVLVAGIPVYYVTVGRKKRTAN